MVETHYFKIEEYNLPVLVINLKSTCIISIPTQIGCLIDCNFCISKDNKFIRNLTSHELISLSQFGASFSNSNNIKLSFTGEGEPFLNLNAINSTIDYFSYSDLFSSFRLCSSGIKPKLFNKITNSVYPIELQFSLHSPFDDTRKRMIPLSQPISDILDGIRMAEDKYSSISINYVLMAHTNDSEKDLIKLSSIIDKNWLIKLNPLLDNSIYQNSQHYDYFYNYLNNKNHNVVLFNKIGSSIKNTIYDTLTYHQGMNTISSCS